MKDWDPATSPGYPPYETWFAWYPVRDEDGNWCWWKYVRREEDGTIKRFCDDVDD